MGHVSRPGRPHLNAFPQRRGLFRTEHEGRTLRDNYDTSGRTVDIAAPRP